MSAVITPGDEQRQAADPAACVWVSANAGSGKTRVLTDRVIRILLQQDQPRPERILCLTYTKAAAAEMKDSLFERLGKWTLLADADLNAEIAALTGQAPDRETCLRARRWFALALETPGGLKVQTIHSFCESVLHRFPMEAGVQPEFEVLEDQTAKVLFARALDEAIGLIAHSEALRVAFEMIAARVGLDDLAKLVDETAKAARAGQLSDISGKLRRIFKLDPGDTLDSLDRALREGMDKPALRDAAKALDKGTDAERDKKVPVLFAMLDGQDQLNATQQYRGLFLKKDNHPLKDVTTKTSREADPGCEAIMRIEQDRVHEIRQQELGLMLLKDIESLALFSGIVREAYENAKRRRGFLDYDDLIIKTADLLDVSGMAPWVLYKLDGGLDHILVDESQDTSPDQWRVIRALAEEFLSGEGRDERLRTMFSVGDEKQSIYSFRGADPRAVAEAREWFKEKTLGAHLPWLDPRLEASFRSTPAVLKFVDEVFSNPVARVGLQENPDETVRHRAHRQNRPGRVELWPPEVPDDKPDHDDNWLMPLDLPDEESGVLKLARKISDTIHTWLTGKHMLPARNRPICPDDILILVRSRGVLFSTLARELKRRGVPIAGVDRMVLTEDIAVMDLLALARFSLLPEDDLTLATILKSPLIGLGEEDLFTLAHDRQRKSLWQRLKDVSGQPVFSGAHDLLAELLGLADHMPPFAWFSHILERQAGRRKFLARLGAEINDPLDEFLNKALDYERKFTPSLQGFIDWMERGATEIKREQDRENTGVRLMTIHGAKGLEANVVFLPDSCTKPDGRHLPALIPLEDGGDQTVIWRKSEDGKENPTLVSDAKADAIELIAQEHRRLLYVAMTRARDWLVICGALNGKQMRKSDPAPDEGSWYDLVEPAMKKLGTPTDNGLVFDVSGHEVDQEDEGGPVIVKDALPGCFLNPPPPESIPPRPLAPSSMGLDDPGPGSGGSQDRALALARGNLIHHLLEFLPDLPREARQAVGPILVHKHGAGLTPAQQKNALAETLRVLDHPDFSQVFETGSMAEVPVSGLVTALGPYAISGQIDRLVVTSTEVLIVDYKTNRQAPSRMADVPDMYLYQLAVYRAALAEIYPQLQIRCALLWTSVPDLMEIPQEMLLQVETVMKDRTLP